MSDRDEDDVYDFAANYNDHANNKGFNEVNGINFPAVSQQQTPFSSSQQQQDKKNSKMSPSRYAHHRFQFDSLLQKFSIASNHPLPTVIVKDEFWQDFPSLDGFMLPLMFENKLLCITY